MPDLSVMVVYLFEVGGQCGGCTSHPTVANGQVAGQRRVDILAHHTADRGMVISNVHYQHAPVVFGFSRERHRILQAFNAATKPKND